MPEATHPSQQASIRQASGTNMPSQTGPATSPGQPSPQIPPIRILAPLHLYRVFLCHTNNPINDRLRATPRRSMVRLNLRYVDLSPRLPLNHVNLPLLNLRFDYDVPQALQVRHGDVLEAGVRQRTRKGGRRVLHQPRGQALALLPGRVREGGRRKLGNIRIEEPAVFLVTSLRS